jgi:WD40 repeat protein
VADVFVSYSRRDGEFVSRLAAALNDRGREAWVDIDGIRDAEVFPAALRAAIEQSDGFLFVISPDSVASAYCEQEVEHARELNKRIVPLLLRPVADGSVPEAIRVRNWIPFTDGEGEFEPGVSRVVDALDTDLEWTREHTRWLVKALEWDGEGRERSFLLRGSELTAAEAWLAQEAGKEPEPTALQREYAAASRVAATRRQRRLAGVAGAVAAVSLGLLVFALISRSQAIGARNAAREQALTAKSQALAAESQTQLAVDPERSILLAVAAMRDRVTPEATFSLRAALDASPIRYRLPDAGLQTCGQGGFTAPGVAFSPDGRRVAEGLCGGVVALADAHTGHVLRRLHVGGGPFGGIVAYSPDGKEIAACCRRTRVLLLDAASGRVRAVGPVSGTAPLAFAFDPKTTVLALGGFGKVLLWNYDSGHTRTLRFARGRNPPPAVSLAFSPDGRRLAGSVPGSPGLGVLDVRTGRRLATSTAGFGPVAYSPDGRTLAAALELPGGAAGRIVLLDARTLELRRTLLTVQDVQPTAVAYSPDGSRLAYGFADGTAGLIALGTGRRVVSYLGQTAAISAVSFSPDGRFVATGSSDGTTRVWRASPEEEHAVAVGGTAFGGAATPRGLQAMVLEPGRRGGEFVVQAWKGAGLRPVRLLELAPAASVDAVFMSADGRFAGVAPSPPSGPPTNGGAIVVGGTTSLRIWSVPGRRVVRTIPRIPEPTGGAPAFSPDDRLVALSVAPPAVPRASASGPGTLKFEGPGVAVVDLRTGALKRLGSTSCSGGWRGLAFSPVDRLLAAGDFCGRVEVWNLATERRVGNPFSIGGELAQIAFAPSGRRIAIAGWNGVVTVADPRTGRIVSQLTGDTSGVPFVDYSPDGRFLASASLDHTARVYDASTLRLLRVWQHPDPVEGLGFTTDSRHIATVDSASVLRLWDACTACQNPRALLALARTRVTRNLTPQERRTFGVG